METKELLGKSVLLIDDSELDTFVTRSIIRQSNFSKQITDFLSPIKALEFLKSVKSDFEQIPEIIFLDISMPFMDGFQFLSEFEKLPESIKTKTKIVMLTSSISNMDIEKANGNAHVIKFLNKPLTKEKLLELTELN